VLKRTVIFHVVAVFFDSDDRFHAKLRVAHARRSNSAAD
jgi:hypothetical protein